MLKALPGIVLLLLLWGGVAPGNAAPLAPPYDLYDIGPLEDRDLRAFSEAPGGWEALHQERAEGLTWLLLALPDGVPADPPGGMVARPRYLGRVRDGERVILSAPVETGPRLRTGRPVTVTPSGGTVHVTTDTLGRLARRGPHQFRVLEQAAAPPPPRSPGPPEGFAEVLERAGRVIPGIGLRAADDVRALRDSVSLDSLESYVRALSEEASGGVTSRWWEDSRTRGVYTDYIVRQFEAALVGSGGRVFQHGFRVPSEETPGDTVDVFNIIGHLPAAGQPGGSHGSILVTAHFDATGFRNEWEDLCAGGFKDNDLDCDCANPDTTITPANPQTGTPADTLITNVKCDWSGQSDPAPGADDNATGVGALIECARVLAPLSFDFDLYFVAFQAEEIGLVGSAAYADSVARGDQAVWGVLNVDMLGYNAFRNEIDVMTDESSEWLADWIVDSAEQFVPTLPIEKYVEPFGRSDHASFWARGIDAVLLVEDKDLPYPGYHRVSDTWFTMVDAEERPQAEEQLRLAVQLAVVTVGRFAVHYDNPDLAIPAGAMSARPLSPTRGFIRGQAATLAANVHNFGSSSLSHAGVTTDSLTTRVRFYDGHPDSAGSALLDEIIRKDFFPSGGQVEFSVSWDTAAAEPGFHDLWSEVEGLDAGYPQNEASRNNNRSFVTVFLQASEGEGPQILSHYAYPNPAPSAAGLGFYYELTKDSSVRMLIYDLEGTLVSQLSAGIDRITDGNQAGSNRIGARAFAPDLDTIDLTSGVYLYVLRVGDGNQFTDHVKGKFAIVN